MMIRTTTILKRGSWNGGAGTGTSVATISGLPGGRGVRVAGNGDGVHEAVRVGAREGVRVTTSVAVKVGAGDGVNVGTDVAVAVFDAVGATVGAWYGVTP